MQFETTLYFGETKEQIAEKIKAAQGELLIIETGDCQLTRNSFCAHPTYRIVGTEAFFPTMNALVSDHLNAEVQYKYMPLAPVGGWPVAIKKEKILDLNPEEAEIMRKAAEIRQRKRDEKKPKAKLAEASDSPAESGEVAVKKTKTQLKKERAAARSAAQAAADAAFIEGDKCRSQTVEKPAMSRRTTELNDIAKQIGPSWIAETSKIEAVKTE